ncbi:hypothetical protein GBA52_009935 [Prunus armeniaca]|nr:hypothetical protein GBA52_009935 [Prunus armeniaca]
MAVAATLLPSTPYKPLPLPFPNSLFLLSFSIPCTRHHFTPPASSNRASPFPLHPRRPYVALPSSPGRCFAANSGPPLPPPESDSTSLTELRPDSFVSMELSCNI